MQAVQYELCAVMHATLLLHGCKLAGLQLAPAHLRLQKACAVVGRTMMKALHLYTKLLMPYSSVSGVGLMPSFMALSQPGACWAFSMLNAPVCSTAFKGTCN